MYLNKSQKSLKPHTRQAFNDTQVLAMVSKISRPLWPQSPEFPKPKALGLSWSSLLGQKKQKKKKKRKENIGKFEF